MLKKIRLGTGLFYCLTLLACHNRPCTRIACVGDSITYGAGIRQRNSLSYPAQLQQKLGIEFCVGNFGIGGRTALHAPPRSYRKHKIFKRALRFQPDMVVILLGTNDLYLDHWIHKGDFIRDYSILVEAFQDLPTNPAIFLCTPPPVFGEETSTAMSRMQKELIPKIQFLAQEKELEIIDLHQLFLDKAVFFPDGVHPSEAGARLISEEIGAKLQAQAD